MRETPIAELEEQLPFTASLRVKLPREERGPTPDVAAQAARLFGYRSTGRRDKVLILAGEDDKHADAVALHLFASGTGVVRFDIGRFPASGMMSLQLGGPDAAVSGILAGVFGEMALDDVRSVWFRPDLSEIFGLDPPSDPLAAFVHRESLAAFEGFAALLERAFWVNSTASLQAAASKVRQLKEAAALGMETPRTLVTNDPRAARRFVGECGGDAIVKAFRGMIGPESDPSLVFTSRVTGTLLAELERVRAAPCLFQERIPNAGDIRVTVIGRTLFPVEVGFEPQDDVDADWRKVETPNTPYRHIELPWVVADACRALMDRFGLAAATIDLIRRPDGGYVFLEVNAQANWLWLEARTGLPIAQAMARLLAAGRIERADISPERA